MKVKIASDKVAIYIRWSTEDQGQGHTLEIQRESCRYYCLSQGWAARNDLTFIDDGCSGSTLERPALTRLRSLVRVGQVDCVVVYKLDRLSRNIKDIINLVLDEWEGRCSVRSTQEPVDTTTDAGKMFFTLLGSFADFERSTIRSRTWSGKRKSAEKGRNPGIPYPYGFARGEGGGFVQVEHEAAVVRAVFDQYLKGGSCRLIAFGLNERGLRTRSGRLWANADISRMLRNPLYAGRLVYNRRTWAQKRRRGAVVENEPDEVIRFDGAAPAIVEPGLWEQVQRVRQARPRFDRPGNARNQSSPYLLSGLLVCPCGHSWVGVRGGKANGRFYGCAGARAKGPARCRSRLVKAAALDQFVLERVRQTWPVKGAFRADMMGRLSEQYWQQQEYLEGLRRQQEALAGALLRFRTDYKRGKLSADMYAELTEETREEREQLNQRVRAAEAELHEISAAQVDLRQAEDWYHRLDAWDALELPEKQQLLRMLVSVIRVSRPKGSADVTIHLAWRLPPPPTRASGGPH